jgi:hypothetical protein
VLGELKLKTLTVPLLILMMLSTSLTTLIVQADSTLSLSVYKATSLTGDGTYVYVGARVALSYVYEVLKVNPTSMTVAGAWSGSVSHNINAVLYLGGYVYAADGGYPSRLYKIDATTMTSAGVWVGSSSERLARSLATDGTYIYVLMWDSSTGTQKIARINPATMTETSYYNRSGSECMGIVYVGGYLYYTQYSSPGLIVKVASSTLSYVSSASTAAYPYKLTTDGVSIFISHQSIPGKVTKYDSSLVLQVTWDESSLGLPNHYAGGITYDMGFIYVADTSVNPGYVHRLNSASLALNATWTAPSGFPGEVYVMGGNVYSVDTVLLSPLFYKITTWAGGGGGGGSGSTWTLTVQPPSGSGTTNPATGIHTYADGASFIATAYPATNYTFSNWLVNGTIDNSNPVSIVIHGNTTIQALFSEVAPLMWPMPVGYQLGRYVQSGGYLYVIIRDNLDPFNSELHKIDAATMLTVFQTGIYTGEYFEDLTVMGGSVYVQSDYFDGIDENLILRRFSATDLSLTLVTSPEINNHILQNIVNDGTYLYFTYNSTKLSKMDSSLSYVANTTLPASNYYHSYSILSVSGSVYVGGEDPIDSLVYKYDSNLNLIISGYVNGAYGLASSGIYLFVGNSYVNKVNLGTLAVISNYTDLSSSGFGVVMVGSYPYVLHDHGGAISSTIAVGLDPATMTVMETITSGTVSTLDWKLLATDLSYLYPAVFLNTDANVIYIAKFNTNISSGPVVVPPSNEAGILNLEGCGNWVFQGHTIYEVYVNSTVVAGSNSTGWGVTQGIGFSDSSGKWYSALWDAALNQTDYVTPEEGVTLSLLSHVSTSTTSSSLFGMIFEPNISDSFNVTLYTYGGINPTPTWDPTYPNYFNIYNIGGYSRYLFGDGTSYHPAGGDSFDLVTSMVGGYAYSDLTYRYLQHVHFLVSLDTGTETSPGVYLVAVSPSHAYFGCLEYGIEICRNQTWIKEWSVRLDVENGDVNTHSLSPNTSWVTIRVRWYHLGVLVKTEYICTYDWGVDAQQDLIPTQQPVMKFWVDLWFNSANASQTVAGRVNSYWSGMDSSGFWIADNYYAKYGNVTDSMFHAPLEDENGVVFSAKDLKMMRVYENMTMTGTNDVWKTYGYDVFAVTKATDTMAGIDTPSSEFQPTQDPALPMGTLLGGLSSIMQGVAAAISQAINYGALTLSGYFWGATGWFFGLMGQPDYVKNTLTWIQQLSVFVWTGASWMFSLLGAAFWLMSWFYNNVVLTGMGIWANWMTMFQHMYQIFTGAYAQGTNIWTYLDIPTWIMLFLIVAPFMILDTYSKKSIGVLIKDARELVAFLDDHVMGLIMRTISFFRDLIFDMIEAIPVVE